jgi:hypothetical protein
MVRLDPPQGGLTDARPDIVRLGPPQGGLTYDTELCKLMFLTG